MKTEMKITRSIFGNDIDRRCPGWGFFAKMFVYFGIVSDKKNGEHCADIDELDDIRTGKKRV